MIPLLNINCSVEKDISLEQFENLAEKFYNTFENELEP